MVNEIDTTLIYTTGDKLFYGNIELTPHKKPSNLKVFFECVSPTSVDGAHLAKVMYRTPTSRHREQYLAEEYRINRLVGTMRKILDNWKSEIIPVEVDVVDTRGNTIMISKERGWDHHLLTALANNAMCYLYGDMVFVDGTYPFRQPCCKGLVAVKGYTERVWVMPYMLYSVINTLIDSYIERGALAG